MITILARLAANVRKAHFHTGTGPTLRRSPHRRGPSGSTKLPRGTSTRRRRKRGIHFKWLMLHLSVMYMLLLEQQSLCAAMDKMVMHPSVHVQARADCQEHGRHAKEDSSIPGETSLSQPSWPWHCRASKRCGLQASKSSTAAFMSQAMRADGMSHFCSNAGVEAAKALIITA